MAEFSELKNEIEAILFSSGRVITLTEIKLLLDIKEDGLVKETVNDIKSDYKTRNSPISLIEEGDGWKLIVREKYLGIVHSINPHTEMSKAILETLAIVAWKQPILQAEVVNIRSNKAYEHIKDLVEQGFLSKERQGRSYLLKTTQKFLDYFDLPHKKAIKEVFKDFADLKNVLPQKKVEDYENKLDGSSQAQLALPQDPEKIIDTKNQDANLDKLGDTTKKDNVEGEKVGSLETYDSAVPLEKVQIISDDDSGKNKAQEPAEKIGDLDVVPIPSQSENQEAESVEVAGGESTSGNEADSNSNNGFESDKSNSEVDGSAKLLEEDLEKNNSDHAKELADQLLETHKDLPVKKDVVVKDDIFEDRNLHPELEDFIEGESVKATERPEQELAQDPAQTNSNQNDGENDSQKKESKNSESENTEKSESNKNDSSSEGMSVPEDAMPIKHDSN